MTSFAKNSMRHCERFLRSNLLITTQLKNGFPVYSDSRQAGKSIFNETDRFAKNARDDDEKDRLIEQVVQ